VPNLEDGLQEVLICLYPSYGGSWIWSIFYIWTVRLTEYRLVGGQGCPKNGETCIMSRVKDGAAHWITSKGRTQLSPLPAGDGRGWATELEPTGQPDLNRYLARLSASQAARHRVSTNRLSKMPGSSMHSEPDFLCLVNTAVVSFGGEGQDSGDRNHEQKGDSCSQGI
jgi:hypothetical protein